MTSYVNRLPEIFRTQTEREFFSGTFDQVFSKKDSDLLAGYLGRRTPGSYNPISDFYLPEPSKNRTWWQLEATAYAKDKDTNKTNIFFYEDLLNRIEYYGGNTLNQDRLFESEYYSFGPPIDYDMFINYQNYYWVEQGLTTIQITGVQASDILGKASYTTPSNAIPANFTLTTGLTILLVDDPVYNTSHVVENLGGCLGIALIAPTPDFTSGTTFEFLPWDGVIQLSTGRIIDNTKWDSTTWETEAQPGNSDYITIERGSADRNAWSRTNKWFHIDAINKTAVTTGIKFPSNASRALRPIIQFVANLNLYNSGTQFRDDLDYGFRDDLFGNPILLSNFQSQPVATLNSTYSITLIDGHLVSFFNDTTPTTQNKVYQYIYVTTIHNDGTVTFSPKTSYSTPVVAGDIVFVVEDGPYDSAQRGQTWYFTGSKWQEAYNDKISVNQTPLFQLYDHNGISLDDSATYPGSTFHGSTVFSYKVNETPGASVDPVLKFPIVYTSLGQATDIVFSNDLITDRYTYTTSSLPIDGYYYYKISTIPVLYNNWNLYDICDCTDITPPPPCNCLETSKQRVIDKFTVGFGSEFKFKLSVTPFGYPSVPDIIVSVNGAEVKSSSVQTNGYTFETVNNSIYVVLTNYLANILLTSPSVPPVVEIQTYTHDLLDPSTLGYFAIPQQLEANPNQQEIGDISGSGLIPQFSSIISNQIGINGTAFGGSNNYRDSRKNRSLGQFILQNLAPVLKTMLVSSSDDLDFIQGVRFSSDEYTKFKSKYLSSTLQLINQEFDPVAVHNNSVIINQWVGQILNNINISKEFSNAFAYSYMIANGTPTFEDTVTISGNSYLTLVDYIDLSDPRNVMYVYDVTDPNAEKLLLVGEDYDIVSINLAIEIKLNLGSGLKTLVIDLYKSPLPAYIPSTPSKLGTYSVYLPRIELDATYVVPTNVIIGHDGSKTIAYGDYRDQLLLELEKRIYNFIQSKFINQYSPPLRVESIRSGFYRQTRYSRDEYLNITESYLNKWSAKYKANYRANDWTTANVGVPTNQLWKLYNYRSAVTPTGTHLNLPGNWKGIFQYYYDTYYPDTRPWEMLGLSEQPDWWITEYGAPLTNLAGQKVWGSTASSAHNLYNDLEAGIIRQGPSAVYDPLTLLPISQVMWARPGLSSKKPVTSAGEIVPITTLFNVAVSGNQYNPFEFFDEDWIYGDGSPVEQAWMSSSAYAYNVQEFMYLMKPSTFGELLFDTLGTELSPGTLTIIGIDNPVQSSVNWQYVQNANYSNDDPLFSWMRPKNKDQVVHAEIVDGTVQIRFGYQSWISDRLLFLGKNISDTFGQKVRTLDVNLGNKFAGFTNKDTTNTYIESVTPGATNDTLIIPSTNFNVFLHTSPPVDTYSYSGVIIKALADGTFAIYGYDLLNSQFTILNRSNQKLVDITIGGTPAEFTYFNIGATYQQGDIVRYNGVYYESLKTQTITKFVSADWQKLNGLPTVGGVSVTYMPLSLTTTSTVPYGSILKSPQAVFDVLIGYGEWLKSQGWSFDEVSPDTNQISDWLASAKQFLFWLNTNWAPSASIQLSPLANKATLVVKRGYPNDVETLSNGIYSILDKNGIAISPQNTNVNRDGLLITVEPNTVSLGIYFLQVSASETEHILLFDNNTSFNDTIYSPLLRARQQRLRFNGFRSNAWIGKKEAPGYLIIGDQLVPNFDTIVDSMRYFYDANVTIDNPSLEDLGRHLIGYESKSYLDNLQVSNDVQYLFYQGAIRQKGTKQAFDKLFRSTKIQSNEVIEVFEEWALKLGNFGNTIEQISTEFILKPEQYTGEVVVARLNFIPSNIGFIRQINILNAEDRYSVIPSLEISKPDATPSQAWSPWSASSTYAIGDNVRYNDPQGNAVYYTAKVSNGPLGSFNPSLWTLILTTRIARAYVVLDSLGRISRIDMIDQGTGYLTAADVIISSGTEPNNLDRLYSVWQGDIIKDTTLDNIIDIDIDQTDTWVVRPQDPAHSLEFPLTDNIVYPIPNAGYVNFNDVNFSSFNVNQTALTWGTKDFNPLEKDTVWIANNFIQDWSVYKMWPSTTPSFDVIADASGILYLRTASSVLITPQFSSSGDVNDFGNLIVLQVIEAQATATISTGTISAVTLTKSGNNYDAEPDVTITGNGTGATAIATIAGGVVTGITVLTPGSGYSVATVTIVPPTSVSPDTNYIIAFEFNQIETTAESTHNYYNLITLDGTPVQATDIPVYANFTDLLLFKTMRFLNNAAVSSVPAYIENHNKIWMDLYTKQISNPPPPEWAVLTYLSSVFVPFREQEQLIDTSLFQSASVFNSAGTELVQLPIYDPFKNILPGPAKQNITYYSLQDPARYNVTGNVTLFSQNIIFGPQQVGQLWWDLSDTRFVYYEQPLALDGSETTVQNLVYRRDKWGKIFPGSTVNIYEWVQSSVPPLQYAGSGIPKDTSTYVQIVTSNKFTNATEIKYYFWVLGSKDKPNIENRTMAAIDVARMLQSPKSQGFAFFCPIQQTTTNNSYMFYNVQEILAYQGDNIQIEYRLGERDDQKHAQWSFFREGDSGCIVTDQFWNKMVDSICGYTKTLPVDGEFLNGIIVADFLPWDIYGWDISPWDDATTISTPAYGEILPVPDPSLSEYEKYGITYRPRQGMFVNLLNARKIFMQSANSLLSHISIRDNNPGWNTNVTTDVFWKYTTWYAIGYENANPSIVFSTTALAQAALTAGQLQVGTILQVTNGTPDGRFILYAVVQINPNINVLSLNEIAIENSAIELLDTIYTTINNYGLSVELRQLCNAFRTEVMINIDLVDQNELFFSMMNYVISEQKNPNWLFKSSYIYIKENNIPLTQDQLFIPDQIDNIIDYIVDSKPYHTQIRDYSSSYTTSDITSGTASDSYKWAITLQFGPNYGGNLYYPTINNADPMIGWDYDQGTHNKPWDSFNWDVTTMSDVINQFVSRNNIIPQNDPGTGNPWPSTFQVSLTFYDASKVGYSNLYPYTFDFSSLNLNNPQSFITPNSIVSIQLGSNTLYYGIDYYVEYNTGSSNYTAYFFNNPGSTTPIAFVWMDGGDLSYIISESTDNETYNGVASDNMTVNVDTRLPVNNSTGVPTPYVGYGEYWDSIPNPIAQILIDAGGSASIGWDTSLTALILPNTVSYKQSIDIDRNNYYRNALKYSGNLSADLLAPNASTYNTQTVTVFVDPSTHAITDVLPNPGVDPGVIWINGERIEYKVKELTSTNTWTLSNIARGTNNTGIVEHLAMIPSVDNLLILVPNPVWVEAGNIVPGTADTTVWNLLSLPGTPQNMQSTDHYTSVSPIATGGLWYANTPQARFLKNEQGIAVP